MSSEISYCYKLRAIGSQTKNHISQLTSFFKILKVVDAEKEIRYLALSLQKYYEHVQNMKVECWMNPFDRDRTRPFIEFYRPFYWFYKSFDGKCLLVFLDECISRLVIIIIINLFIVDNKNTIKKNLSMYKCNLKNMTNLGQLLTKKIKIT